MNPSEEVWKVGGCDVACQGIQMRVEGLRLRIGVGGLRSGCQVLRLRVQGLGCRGPGLWLNSQKLCGECFGFRVSGVGFWVPGLVCMV